MKNITKKTIQKQFKKLGVKKSDWCKEHGFDPSNFAKTYTRISRNLEELKEFLDKMGLEIKIK